MRRRFAVLAACIALLAAGTGAAAPDYPVAVRGDVVDAYYGTMVADPYRWLESIKSPATATWVAAENEITARYFATLTQRTAIAADLAELHKTDGFQRPAEPKHIGAHWFTWDDSSRQPSAVLYVSEQEHGARRVLFDPNVRTDGEKAAFGPVSSDGRYILYFTSASGYSSDWQTWHVRDAATGRDLSDTVRWGKWGAAHWDGSRGFYYPGYATPQDGRPETALAGLYKAFFHKIGTPQSNDRSVFAHAEWFVQAQLTQDHTIVLMFAGKGTGNGYFWRRRSQPDAPFRVAVPMGAAFFRYVGNHGDRLFFRTDNGAPAGRLIWVDVRDPQHVLHTIVPQTRDILTDSILSGNRFYLQYLHDASARVSTVDINGGSRREIDLPGLGSAWMDADLEGREVEITFSSFTSSSTIYRYDVRTNKLVVYDRSRASFDAAQYVTERFFAKSEDGTNVPVFVAHRRDMKFDGTTPTLLTGYGGFAATLTPYFSPETAAWLDMGGAYALANVRGGGEYGENWHRAGMGPNKQRVFDDFIAVARYLIARGITSPRRLAITGHSGGGLLVGAAMTQHPELFGSASIDAGVLDMLRFNVLDGPATAAETGRSDGSPSQFADLYAYSPYHHIKDGVEYPATLVLTSMNDSVVSPAHSYKFVAALQHAQAGTAPILLWAAGGGGHFATDDVADQYAFLMHALHAETATHSR